MNNKGNKDMKVNKNKIKSYLKNILTGINLCPRDAVMSIGVRVLISVISIVQIGVVADLIDSVEVFVSSSSYHEVLNTLVFLVGVVMVQQLLVELKFVMDIKLQEQIGRQFKSAIYEKVSRIKYRYIEEEKTWKDINLLYKNSESRMFDSIINIADITSLIVQFLGYLFIIITHSILVGTLLVLLIIPIVMLANKLGDIDYRAFDAAEEVERRSDAYKKILSSKTYVYERKVFDYAEHINHRWNKRFIEVVKIYKEAFASLFTKLGITYVLSRCFVFLISVLLLWLLSQGRLTVGLFIALTYYSLVLMDLMTQDLLQQLKASSANARFYEMYNDFMAIEERSSNIESGGGVADAFCVQFKNVSFKYPKTDRTILKNVSFELSNGSNTAFVGKNGSGKTTIVKLLLGLYDDYEGSILLNGQEIRDLNDNQISAIYEVAFQDFYRYCLPVKDYIALGSKEAVHMDSLIESVKKVGMMATLKARGASLDFELGKISASVDFSGGEWQKLLLSRIFYSSKPIRILDEPTAAIDPIEEAFLYNLFNEVDAAKMCMTITHRLGAAKNADQIIVIDEGRVVEQGNHETLMDLKGVYHHMFNLQKEWYHG